MARREVCKLIWMPFRTFYDCFRRCDLKLFLVLNCLFSLAFSGSQIETSSVLVSIMTTRYTCDSMDIASIVS